jgi:hypothetical protein
MQKAYITKESDFLFYVLTLDHKIYEFPTYQKAMLFVSANNYQLI